MILRHVNLHMFLAALGIAGFLTACNDTRKAPAVVDVPATSRPVKEKNWLDRTAEETWKTVKEPVDWFKTPPKEKKAPTTEEEQETGQPVNVIIIPRDTSVSE